jgi:hypothetical protein
MVRNSLGVFAGLCLLIGGAFAPPSLRAQEGGAKVTPPPKVLVIDIEYLKPGKFGSAHQKTESAFVTAAQNAKSPNHYLASQALSGPPRTIFTFGYDSFADFEKELKAESTGPLAAQLDSAYQADGELLTSMSRGVFVYHENMSVNAPCAIGTMRYIQISRIKLHPGQTKNWQDFLKIWKDAETKTNPDAHIAIFSQVFGTDSAGVWLLVHPMKSLAEVDDIQASTDKFRQNVGDWAHYQELLGTMVEAAQTNLYSFDPSMSYVSDDWANADPTFWKKNQ